MMINYEQLNEFFDVLTGRKLLVSSTSTSMTKLKHAEHDGNEHDTQAQSSEPVCTKDQATKYGSRSISYAPIPPIQSEDVSMENTCEADRSPGSRGDHSSRVIRSNVDVAALNKKAGEDSESSGEKVIRLEAQVEKFHDENKRLRDRCTKLELDLSELTYKYHKRRDRDLHKARFYADLQLKHDCLWSFQKKVVNEHVLPFANQNGITIKEIDDALDEKEFFNTLGFIVNEANVSAHLKIKLEALQNEMLANVDKTQSISDDQFQKDFGLLASSIRTFSRSIKIPAETNLLDIKIFRSVVLTKDVSETYLIKNYRRKDLIESVVWSVIMHLVFEDPFVLLGPSCSQFSDAFQNLFGKGSFGGWPIPQELCERWRCVTLQHITGNKLDMIKYGPSKNQIEEDFAQSLMVPRSTIYHTLYEAFSSLSPKTDFSKLEDIINQAVALALSMYLERSRLQLVWPDINAPFVMGETPHLVNVAEEDDLEFGTVAFIVNPGLAKWGNAHGKNLEVRSDVVPSLVFIEPRLQDKTEIDDSRDEQPGGVDCRQMSAAGHGNPPGAARELQGIDLGETPRSKC